MKKHFLYRLTACILLTISYNLTYAQNKIGYTYDKTGNRIIRQLIVTPCNNCPQNPETGRKAAPIDTTQAIVHGVKVFPNPTQDKVMLTIGNLQDGETPEVIVTDETGKTLYTAKNLQAQNEINMTNYNTGTYFVRLIMGKDIMVYKVMKIQ